MRRGKSDLAESTKKSSVVTKAFLRSVNLLEMSRADVSALLGVSEASLTRLYQGGRVIDLATKEGEIAVYFLRLYRSLDTLFGGNAVNAIQWFKSRNSHLGGVPLELVKSIGGLVEVAGYLDSMRGKV